jgi:deazaflavin-dependent oxidoreductase (nitroreductase family)
VIHKGDLLRWVYRGGRPNRVGALLNRWSVRLGAVGLAPGRLATLEVRGRRSGRPISFPVVVADHRGERYLVAMLGPRTNWVRNLEAAGGAAVLRRGRPEEVHLEAVDPSDRAPILRRYLELAPGGRPHIPVDHRAPLAEFERVAADYPVFRCDRPGSPRPGAAADAP